MDNGFPKPIQVALVDDDYSALKESTQLLLKDLRTTVCAEFDSAAAMLSWLKETRNPPDAIVLDAEYRPGAPPISRIVGQIKEIYPEIFVICLSQYGDSDVVYEAVEAGIDGFLLKDDVRVALATGVVRTCKGSLTYTPGVQPSLESQLGHRPPGRGRIERWHLHPELTPRLEQVARLCFLRGFSAPEAALELNTSDTNVERYKTQVINILADGWWYDRSDLGDLEKQLTREQWSERDKRMLVIRGQWWAFHILTQPPRRDALEWFSLHQRSRKRRWPGTPRFL